MRDDIGREESLRSDAGDTMARLQAEAAELQQQIDDAEPQRATAAQTGWRRSAPRLTPPMPPLPKRPGRVRAAVSTRDALATRIGDLQRRIAGAEAALADISLDSLADAAAAATATLSAAEADAVAATATLATADEKSWPAPRQRRTQRRMRIASPTTQNARLQAEIDALGYLLAGSDGGNDIPILDSLSVSGGMEAALTACLADELSAPAGSGEMAYWRGGADATGLAPPDGSTPLAAHITGAPELAAALAGIGIVSSSSEAQVMQPDLAPGQALTTPDGGLWRWDGFVRKAGAVDAGAERIRQRQRLEELQTSFAEATASRKPACQALEDAEAALAAAREAQAGCRAEAATADQALATARRDEESCRLRLAASQERAGDLQTGLETMRADLATAQTEAEELGDDAALAAAENQARQAAETQRGHLAEAMQAESQLAATLRAARDRQQSCLAETGQWQERQAGATARVEQMRPALPKPKPNSRRWLRGRTRSPRNVMPLPTGWKMPKRFASRPADALRTAETALAEAETAQRQADASLAEGRETQIRAEGARERAEETRRVLLAQIEEKLGCGPDGLRRACRDRRCRNAWRSDQP